MKEKLKIYCVTNKDLDFFPYLVKPISSSARAMGMPLTRPKSLTYEALKEL